ncbi:BglG family transcription antiterminator [Shouchella clausii]|uniref:BglG family transcription antiterminator n=1 Tax=Shouchella clausii TaxID=79880 RepID=UPI00211CBB8A|nr:BglG family transcription antiterminator [Shouchella clausii]
MKTRNGGRKVLDERSYTLLKTITQHRQVTKPEVLRMMQVSERQFGYDFDKLNYALKNLHLPPIQLKNNTFILEENLIQAVESGELYEINPALVTISKEDRVYLLYLYTFIRKEPISNFHYQTFLGVSKNTALEDVKRTREICEEWNLSMIYSRKDGYYLIGDEFDKRRLALYAVNILLDSPFGNELIHLPLNDWGYDDFIEETESVFAEVVKKHSIMLVKSRKNEILPFLTYLRARKKYANLNFPEYQEHIIERQNAFLAGKEMAETFFGKEAVSEQYFVSLMLLISMQESKYENALLEQLAERIIEEFERVTLLPLENRETLKKSLYDHLVPAFFRISFKIPLVNPLINRIKEEYPELFEFVKIALAPLSMWTGQVISEEEIGYFTLHFGGYLEKDKRNHSTVNGLIVCSNGVSSSLMLKAQLKEMFPNIHFLNVHSIDQMTEIPKSSYDLIFSTVRVPSTKPVYLVKPLLSQVEKNYLIQEIAKEFPSLNYRNISVDQIIEVIRKYADIRDEERLFSELVHVLYFEGFKKGRYSPMLSELLTKDMISFTDERLDWKEAIRLAAKPLSDTGKIEDSYVDAMINNVEELGAYIHIGKGIAIPHARPQAGVNQVGMSFLRTKTPVLLLDQEQHKIDIFICIAAVDNETHLKALSQLTKILADNHKLKELKQAKTVEEIVNINNEGESK